MSLSPFDSFQSRFVTYLLNFPRINQFQVLTFLYLLFKRMIHAFSMVLCSSVLINSRPLTDFPLENDNSGSCNIIGNKISH